MFNKEQKLLILLSRLTFSDSIKREIVEIVNNGVNWFEFFKLCLYHKTATLCWYNVKQIVDEIYLPKYLDVLLDHCYTGISANNEKYMTIAKNIEEQLENRGITVVPVKGIRMLHDIYTDYGIRFLGDIDYLVKYIDIEEVNKVMIENGYIQGNLNRKSNSVMPIDRIEKMKWKLYMSNLYPYIKIFPDNTIVKLDFRYSLDDSLDQEPINEMINYFIKFHSIRPEMLLLHLCTHFYDEAKHISTIKMAKDLNIIKICDIREFILKYSCEIDEQYFRKLYSQYNLNAQVYFTLTCVYKLYSDQETKKIADQVEFYSNDIMNSYGENLTKIENKFQNDIWERFFSCNNAQELR